MQQLFSEDFRTWAFYALDYFTFVFLGQKKGDFPNTITIIFALLWN